MALNIIASYFLWVYILEKLKKYKNLRRILIGVLVLFLPLLCLEYFMSEESMRTTPYSEYIGRYLKAKENNFLFDWESIREEYN